MLAQILSLAMMVQMVVPVMGSSFGSDWTVLDATASKDAPQYYLADNQVLTSTFQFNHTNGATLDLNGYELSNSGTSSVLQFSVSNKILTIQDSKATGIITGGSAATNGGGMYFGSGTCNMNGGSIAENTARNNGGGVFFSTGTLTMTGGEISENTAGNYGGGVYLHTNQPEFYMSGGTITENIADNGGGVYLTEKSMFNMSAGTITGNNAQGASNNGKGGGVYVTGNSTLSLSGTAEISGNTANISSSGGGGGVYLSSTSSMHLSGKAAITGNTVTTSNSSGGAGIYVANGATLGIADSVQITGNTLANDRFNNVYLETGSIITIEGDLDTTARIGVSTQTAPTVDSPVVFTSGASSCATSMDNFISDNLVYTIALYNDEYALHYVPPTFGGGSGTDADPYLIKTVTDLEILSAAVNGGFRNSTNLSYATLNYTLANDLDLSGIPNWIPIGDSTNKFNGTFDGNGKTLSHLTIHSTNDFQGLFGCTYSNAVIKNLALTDVHIVSSSSNVGGMVGQNEGIIHSCSVLGTITGNQNVGGIAGSHSNSILNCYQRANVTGTDDSANVGGIAGTITSASASASAKLQNCYSTGAVSGTGSSPNVGGIVGQMVASSSVTNNFWNGTVTGDRGIGYPSNTGADKMDTTDEAIAILLSDLSGWVSNNTGNGCEEWKIMSLRNDGYPIFASTMVSLDHTHFDVTLPTSDQPATVTTLVHPEPTYELRYVGIGATTYEPSTTPPTSPGAYTVTIIVTVDTNYYEATLTDPSWTFAIASPSSSALPNLSNIPTSYTNTVPSSSHGSTKISPVRALPGTTILITPSPEDGFEVGGISVTDGSGKTIAVTSLGDGRFSFVQPSGSVSVTVDYVPEGQGGNFEEDSESPEDQGSEEEIPPDLPNFVDIPSHEWYYNSVYQVYSLGLMSGTSSTTFSPTATTSRGMIATMLYNLSSAEYTGATAPFYDVPTTEYYAVPIAWAQYHGFISGYGDGSFAPNGAITREQLALILYNFEKSFSENTIDTTHTLNFSDISEVSDWAMVALQWATANGLLSGKGENRLEPKATAMRAEVAQIFVNYARLMVDR